MLTRHVLEPNAKCFAWMSCLLAGGLMLGLGSQRPDARAAGPMSPRGQQPSDQPSAPAGACWCPNIYVPKPLPGGPAFQRVPARTTFTRNRCPAHLAGHCPAARTCFVRSRWFALLRYGNPGTFAVRPSSRRPSSPNSQSATHSACGSEGSEYEAAQFQKDDEPQSRIVQPWSAGRKEARYCRSSVKTHAWNSRSRSSHDFCGNVSSTVCAPRGSASWFLRKAR